MAFKPTDKEKLLESLMGTHRQGQVAELRLRFQEEPDEAEKIWAANIRLSTEIDILLGRIMEDWLGSAARATADLRKANANLKAAIDDIQKQIKVAQNVVKVVGLLDEAVAIARKALTGAGA
jgi:hypothetical protein